MKDLDNNLYEILINILNAPTVIKYCQIVDNEEASFNFQIKTNDIDNKIFNNLSQFDLDTGQHLNARKILFFMIQLNVIHSKFYMLDVKYQEHVDRVRSTDQQKTEEYSIILTKSQYTKMFDTIHQTHINYINHASSLKFSSIINDLKNYLDSEKLVNSITDL